MALEADAQQSVSGIPDKVLPLLDGMVFIPVRTLKPNKHYESSSISFTPEYNL
jgi:hypothetical protein